MNLISDLLGAHLCDSHYREKKMIKSNSCPSQFLSLSLWHMRDFFFLLCFWGRFFDSPYLYKYIVDRCPMVCSTVYPFYVHFYNNKIRIYVHLWKRNGIISKSAQFFNTLFCSYRKCDKVNLDDRWWATQLGVYSKYITASITLGSTLPPSSIRDFPPDGERAHYQPGRENWC